MKRLRHPIRAIREPFGTAGLVVALVALVAALGGTALAASGALTGKQKKEVEKIAKKYAGKPGAEGKQGPAGTNGKDGTNGTNGTNGKNGEGVTVSTASVAECANGGTKISDAAGSGKACNGAPGTAGTDGASVEELENSSALCENAGGVEYRLSGHTTTVCNGKEGHTGPEGSPWPAGGKLPSSTNPGCPEQEFEVEEVVEEEVVLVEVKFHGCTETGEWAFAGSTNDTNGIHVPISFPIPLEEKITGGNVHFVEGAVNTAACPGAAANPAAAPGQLCVYQSPFHEVTGTSFVGIERVNAIAPGADRTGAMLVFSHPTGAAEGGGTFAVTAP